MTIIAQLAKAHQDELEKWELRPCLNDGSIEIIHYTGDKATVIETSPLNTPIASAMNRYHQLSAIAAIRAAISALAMIKPTDSMIDAAAKAYREALANDPGYKAFRAAQEYILAAAAEGEAP
jgi:hypothetical protein